jgi:hypothetical protein
MCASLALERFGRFYLYSVFTSLSIISRCFVNINISAPKTGVIQTAQKKEKKRNGNFLENRNIDSD